MCNLYSMTKPQQAVRDLARVMGEVTGKLPAFPAIFPDQLAPVVRTGIDGELELVNMRWGFPSLPGARNKTTLNVRAATNGWWTPWLQQSHRCLVPVTSFCEPDWRTGKHVPTWFALDDARSLFFFAGIWRPWTGTRGTNKDTVTGEHLLYAFLTTAPNAEVAPVYYQAMPVLLLNEDARQVWLHGTVKQALSLQRPAPDGTLKIVRTGDKEDPLFDARGVAVQ